MKPLNEIYDITKMKKEDRRLIISYCSNSAMFNAASKLNNTAIFISILSLLVAAYSIVYSVQNKFYSILTIILMIELFLIYFGFHYNANRQVDNIINNIVKDHNYFFEYHYEYAKRK